MPFCSTLSATWSAIATDSGGHSTATACGNTSGDTHDGTGASANASYIYTK